MANPPKPTERKIAQGNPGKRAIPPAVAGLERLSEAPPPPSGLGVKGQAMWSEMWRYGIGWMAITDAALVELVCQQYDLADELTGRLEEADGAEWLALVRLRHQVQDKLVRNLALCGFTPVDRARLNVRIVEGEDRLQEFLRKAGASG